LIPSVFFVWPGTYSHAIPAMQEEAAAPIAGLAFGGKQTGASALRLRA